MQWSWAFSLVSEVALGEKGYACSILHHLLGTWKRYPITTVSREWHQPCQIEYSINHTKEACHRPTMPWNQHPHSPHLVHGSTLFVCSHV